jgi:3-dehydroquinate synthase
MGSGVPSGCTLGSMGIEVVAPVGFSRVRVFNKPPGEVKQLTRLPSLESTAVISIGARSHAYAVHVGAGLLARTGELLRALPFGAAAKTCALVTDSNVAPLYAGPVLASLAGTGLTALPITVPSGEASKSLAETARVADAMIGAGLDRHSFVVALGGGVVGDLAGFVASIFHRGIPLVQIPTTIVAQVDSAVGGKTGVNSSLGKNLLGSFHPPSLVIADVETLQTLPDRDFNEGFAEVIKHGVIRDRGLLETILGFNRRDGATLAAIIRRNVEIKAAVVSADEFERSGERALLNFGHTIGHAIEMAAGYGRLLHGEAISLGMIAAGRLSMEKAGLPASDFARMLACLRHFGLPTHLEEKLDSDAIFASLSRDKKFVAGQIRFVLTSALGSAFLTDAGEVTLDNLRRAVARLREPV